MVFERAYEEIDYISLHRYYNYTPAANMFYPLLDTFADIPHFFTDLQNFLDMAKGAADYVKVATIRIKPSTFRLMSGVLLPVIVLPMMESFRRLSLAVILRSHRLIQ